MIAALRAYLARRRLQRLVDSERESFRIQSYRRNRAAQIKRRKV